MGLKALTGGIEPPKQHPVSYSLRLAFERRMTYLFAGPPGQQKFRSIPALLSESEAVLLFCDYLGRSRSPQAVSSAIS